MTASEQAPRNAEDADIKAIARIWHAGWHDAHAGVALVLIADAEVLLAERGIASAWLACAIGNARAVRFYEKSGWRRSGTVVSTLATPDGVFEVDVWRYEKELLRGCG